MKNTVLILAILISTFLGKAYACQCVEPNYTNHSLEENILDFMEAKRNVLDSDVTSVKHVDTNYFIPTGMKIIIGLFTIGVPREELSCELGCTEYQYQKREYDVTYFDGAKECVQKLFVTAKSSMLGSGYKYRIMKKTHPVCN